MSAPSKGSWRKKFRVHLQVTALLLAIAASFGMYFALQADLAVLAGVCFAGLAASMVLTAWVS